MSVHVRGFTHCNLGKFGRESKVYSHYHPITSYFLNLVKRFSIYHRLIHNDWQSSGAKRVDDTAHIHSHKSSWLFVWRRPLRRLWQLGQICLKLVEQGRQSRLQLGHLNMAALSPLMGPPPFPITHESLLSKRCAYLSISARIAPLWYQLGRAFWDMLARRIKCSKWETKKKSV